MRQAPTSLPGSKEVGKKMPLPPHSDIRVNPNSRGGVSYFSLLKLAATRLWNCYSLKYNPRLWRKGGEVSIMIRSEFFKNL